MWLKIEHDLTTDFKVSWGDKSGQVVLTYSVGRSSNLEAAAKVREELGALYELAAIADPAKSGDDSSVSPTRDAACAGASSTIRPRSARSPRSKTGSRTNTRRRSRPLRACRFQHPCSVGTHLRRRVAERAGDGASGRRRRGNRRFSGFWSLKYELSTTPNGQRVRSRSKLTRGRRTFGLLSLVNSDVHEQIRMTSAPITKRSRRFSIRRSASRTTTRIATICSTRPSRSTSCSISSGTRRIRCSISATATRSATTTTAA